MRYGTTSYSRLVSSSPSCSSSLLPPPPPSSSLPPHPPGSKYCIHTPGAGARQPALQPLAQPESPAQGLATGGAVRPPPPGTPRLTPQPGCFARAGTLALSSGCRIGHGRCLAVRSVGRWCGAAGLSGRPGCRWSTRRCESWWRLATPPTAADRTHVSAVLFPFTSCCLFQ